MTTLGTLDKVSVTFTPYDSSKTINSFDDWGLFMGPPSYQSFKPKDIRVTVPFSNAVLDFTKTKRYFDNSNVTYTFYYVSKQSGSSLLTDMYNTQRDIEDYLWNFYGDVKDSYYKRGMKNCRVMSVACDVSLVEKMITIKVEVTGEPSV